MTCNCLKNCSLEIVNEKPNSGGDLQRCFPTRISIRIREFLSCFKKNKKIKINRPELKSWLSTQNVYTRHKPIVKTFQRNQVITRGIDDLWQIDLADLQKISKYNDNNRYLVTCIDVFSKFGWVVPIKNKKSVTVLEAFKFIINSSGRKPNFLQSDQGTEVLNSKFKEYLSEIDVGFYYVNSE
jgi:hypothetical protein